MDNNRSSADDSSGCRIDHIVILMLENRSFDHMLGYLPGVNGVAPPATGNSPFVNYRDPQHPSDDSKYEAHPATYFGIPEGDIPPPTDLKGISTEFYGGPSHSFPSASEQQFNDSHGANGKKAAGTTPATNSGFVNSYAAELERTYAAWQKKDPTFVRPSAAPREHVEIVMSAFTPEQLPVLSGLAAEYCVCDNWYSEVPGPTEPNRLFMHAATSAGLVHNPWIYGVPARTIYEDIDEQGTRTWASYYFDLADATNFPVLKSQVDKIRHFDQFATDLANPETFPNYVFLCPRYMNSPDGFANSQHAPWDVRYGEHYIADVYEALRASPLWERTLMIVTYDEHGGFYDHVTPPADGVASPDGIDSPNDYDRQTAPYMFNADGSPNPQYAFAFDRLGFRVPTVLISPWIASGQVEQRQLQHTSVLATVRRLWGLRNQPLTAREAQAQPFDDLLTALQTPRTDCPLTLSRPELPELTLSAAADQPLSPAQLDVFNQAVHLDGHEHSGVAAPVPATQGEAAAYLAERNAAHRSFHSAAKDAAATPAAEEHP